MGTAGKTPFLRGLGALHQFVVFYKTIYFNLPQTTRLAGIALVLLAGLIHLYEVPLLFGAAPYLALLFLADAGAALIAAAGIYRGASVWGWGLGALICTVAFAAYVLSRTLGLPGLAQAIGRWENPVGTLSLVVEGLFLGLYLSVITGMNVAAPARRDWND